MERTVSPRRLSDSSLENRSVWQLALLAYVLDSLNWCMLMLKFELDTDIAVMSPLS